MQQADAVLVARTVKGLAHKDPKDLSAWELSLRGSYAFHRRSKTSNAEARTSFEQALRLDSDLALAWYFLALTHQRAIINQWSADLPQSVREMGSVCREFERHHPDDPALRVAKAYTAIYSGDRVGANLLLGEAIELDPNAATAYSLYGQTLAMGNEPEEAIEQFELALRLSPCDGDAWAVQTGLGLCHFVSERYDEMLFWGQRASSSRPELPFPLGVVAVAHACLGDVDGASRAVREMLRLEPAMRVGKHASALVSTHPDIAKRYLEGLRRAGVPA